MTAMQSKYSTSSNSLTTFPKGKAKLGRLLAYSNYTS